MLSKNNNYKTWIEISRRALLHNFKVFQKLVGKKTKIAAVVKADAYGHGLKEVVGVLKNKTSFFAVDNIYEALEVKKTYAKANIIILGFILPKDLKMVIENKFAFVVYRLDILKEVVALKLPVKAEIHLKIETGLNRQGIKGKNLLEILSYIKKHSNSINLTGLYTHFANVEDTLDQSFAETQLENFSKAVKTVRVRGFNPRQIHSAASAAALLLPKSHFNLIRLGIGLYGLWPSRETKIALLGKDKKIVLKPLLSWKSIIIQIKEVKKGESVGYGRAWLASRNSKIAIIPVGYSDGFDRKLSNTGKVIIRGARAPVVGRVAMNMIMVDVTEIKNVREDDEVILIGKSSNTELTAENLAEEIGTINYEVVSRINPTLPRLII